MSELQRKLEAAGSPVRAVAAHPGWAATNLQSHSGNRVENALMAIGNRVFAQSGDMGALPTLYAATQDIPGDTTSARAARARCAATRGSRTASGAAQDAAMAERLWAESERLTGVKFPSELAALAS